MKLIFAIFIFLLNTAFCFAAIDDNIDYNFINGAFANSNGNINRDFDNLMKQYETPREGFFQKMYKFFDKDKVKYDNDFKTKYENSTRRIKDIPPNRPTVLIPVQATDSSGNTVNVGYYQIRYKKSSEGKHILELTQGDENPVAKIPVKETEEDINSKEIVYGKVEPLNNNFIKIVYSNLDLTLVGYLKIIQKNSPEF